MEKSIEDNIFKRAKESLEKLGMYAGEKELIDYDPNINSICKRNLENIIGYEMNIKKIFRNLHREHRQDINDKQILHNVRYLMSGEINPDELVSTLEYLENEGLLSKSEFALSLMQYAYDSKIEDDKTSWN